jgi:uncharacterized protein YbaR (Trm112 family)
MPDRGRRHIAVSPEQRQRLEEAKHRFEAQEGRSDWGAFLGVAVGLGLAVLGIYTLARASRRSERSATIECPSCRNVFAIPLAPNYSRVVEVDCPLCNAQLVVDLGSRREG